MKCTDDLLVKVQQQLNINQYALLPLSYFVFLVTLAHFSLIVQTMSKAYIN